MTQFIVDVKAKETEEGTYLEITKGNKVLKTTVTKGKLDTAEKFANWLLLRTFREGEVVSDLRKRFIIEAHQEEEEPGTLYSELIWILDSVIVHNLPQDQAKVDFSNLLGWANWTTQEAENYIEKNVNDLQSAKNVLIQMSKAIIYLRNFIQSKED